MDVCVSVGHKQHDSNLKHTLSIPEWLNEKATAAGINFSQVLQEALKDRLGITNPFSPLSSQEIYSELAESRARYERGEYEDFDEVIDGIRKIYGL